MDDHLKSTEDWEVWLGSQCRDLRIRAGLDQHQLAARADLSVGAVKNLENGRGCTLKTLIKVLRVLQRTDWLLALAPRVTVSPLQMLAAGRIVRERQKVYRPRGGGKNKAQATPGA